MTTGQRAMASALVLADDGRRENGRWQYGALSQLSESGQSSDFRKRVNESGIILDFAPELAPEVVSGETTLNAAFERDPSARRHAERGWDEQSSNRADGWCE